MKQPDTWIIILNWNGGDETLACLTSLQTLDHPAHTLVIDNGSRDGSPARIAHNFPEVELLEMGTNVGYSRGVNIGIRHALAHNADYVLLLNNDVRVAPAMLSHLLSYAEHNPAYGLFSPLIYQRDCPEQLWVVGGHWHIYTITHEGWNVPDTGQYPIPKTFAILFGTALLIRRSVIEHIGYFDERFFAYYEDADFALRARRAGYLAMVIPEAQVYHTGSYSTRKASYMREFHLARSRMLFYRKQLSGIHILVFLLTQGIRDIRRFGRLIREGTILNATAYGWGVLRGLTERQK
jgi:GT2 family glycosyltransferase